MSEELRAIDADHFWIGELMVESLSDGAVTMIDLPVPRWAARIVLSIYGIGFVSAVVIMAALLVQRVLGWAREKGGW